MAKRSKTKKRSPKVDPGNAAKATEILHGKSSGVPWRTILQAFVIAAAALWIYWPALHGDWLWDDIQLVSYNPFVQDPAGLWKIWLLPRDMPDATFPLKVSVIWLQWHLWGNDTLGYHLTNVFLHLMGALLVWRLLGKFGLRLAWLGGLIFAIHPVQVESVAWIAELKNTLSLPPFLLAMCAWIDFDEQGKTKDYYLALGLFLVAMLCKPTMVMFPVVILLYAWWKRGRIGWKDVKASTSFFLVSLALGLATVWLLQHGVLIDNPVPMGGFFSRLACAGWSLSFYFSKCFLPVGLMPIYSQWSVDPPALWQFLPWPILLAAIYWLWTKRGSWGRHAVLGLGFFLISLAPFLGFTAGSYMAFTWVMDHLLYIPIIGLIGMVVAALGQIESLLPASYRLYGMGLVTVVLALLALESRNYDSIFVNEETFWSYELRHNPTAYLAHNNLGYVFLKTGRQSEAIREFDQALRLNPDYFEAHGNLGLALSSAGRVPEAIDQYQLAVRIRPDNPAVRNDLGKALFQTGQLSQAMEQFEESLRIKPNDAEVHNNLGAALGQAGRFSDARDQFVQALQIKPDYTPALDNLERIDALQKTVPAQK